jgi:cytochrome c oxidase assembly protein subunit 15
VVFLLIGLTLALWFALRAVQAPQRAVRTTMALLIIELAQGAIGFVQYFTHLPVVLVGTHMLGASLVWVWSLAVLWSLRTRPAAEPVVLVSAQEVGATSAESPVPAAR